MTNVPLITEKIRTLTARTIGSEEQLSAWKEIIRKKFNCFDIITVFDVLELAEKIKDGKVNYLGTFEFELIQTPAYEAHDFEKWIENELLIYFALPVLQVQYQTKEVWPAIIDELEEEGIAPPVIGVCLSNNNTAKLIVVNELKHFTVPEFVENYEGTWEKVIEKAHEYQEKLIELYRESIPYKNE